ncbi:MAG: PQQ-binding-like beta-propeller repeat protein [Candidatus Bathyarchaeia archaeon]
MKTIKSKALAILIAAILTISMGASTMLMPNAYAHSPAWNIPTIVYCTVGTNPDGIGQPVNIGFWLNTPPPDASGPYGDRWMGMMVKVTLPDGTTQNLGPFTSDDTGGTHTQFTPAALGTYTFQMSFPGQTLAGKNLAPTVSPATTAFIGDYYEPSTSNVATMTVQQSPAGGVTPAPLPTTYWQTPVNAMNVNNWYAITGADLSIGGAGFGIQYNASSNYNPYTTAPITAHIIWTKPEAFGGVLGGDFGGTTTYGNYYSTAQYEPKYEPVIINGYLYYNVIPGSSTTPTGLVCVDLYTGQTVWTDNADNYGGGSPSYNALTTSGVVTTLKCGEILDFVTPNQYGGLAYLWTTGTPLWIQQEVNTQETPLGTPIAGGLHITGTTLNLFDAETGTYIDSVVNGTSPTLTTDASGDLIGYYNNYTAGSQAVMGTINDLVGPAPTINTQTGPSLTEWNSTECIMAGGWFATAAGWEWRPPMDGIIPFADGIVWRTPIATTLNGNAIPAYTTAPGGIKTINSGVIVEAAYSVTGASYFQAGWGVFSGYSSTTGQQLWVENITMAPFTEDGNTGGGTAGDGVWLIPQHQIGTIAGYSLATGKQLWTTSLVPFNPYDSIGGYMSVLAGGTLYLAGFGGDIWSINMLTGTINWYTNTTAIQGSAGTNSPYGVWPLWGFANGGVADGVLFLDEGHEYSPPLFLGAQQLAINCTTGKLLWDIDAFDVCTVPAMAYGVMTVLNAYDNQIYAYGMGPSATTVSAPSVGVTTSTPITISGTVMDISAGSQQLAVAANFPTGLPCVSDASMTSFMEAVYEQQPMPTNMTGVPVTLYVLDSNNNYRSIGTTTTNAMGQYSLTWTPDIKGDYTVYATFAGTESYYGSSASAAFHASSVAPTPAPTASPLSGLASNNTLMYGIVAIVIVIVIIGAAIMLMVNRKRP